MPNNNPKSHTREEVYLIEKEGNLRFVGFTDMGDLAVPVFVRAETKQTPGWVDAPPPGDEGKSIANAPREKAKGKKETDSPVNQGG